MQYSGIPFSLIGAAVEISTLLGIFYHAVARPNLMFAIFDSLLAPTISAQHGYNYADKAL